MDTRAEFNRLCSPDVYVWPVSCSERAAQEGAGRGSEAHFGLLVDEVRAVAQEEVDHVQLAEVARRVQRRVAGLQSAQCRL